MESPKARQLAEYEVLKAIYPADVQAVDFSEWLDVSIALRPAHDSRNPDVHATIVLRVQCSELYPDKEPTITLSESKGLSKVQIGALQEQLQRLAVELRGEVMILQLAQCVQEFLHDHNKPGTKSFYDEMLERNHQLEEQRNRSEEHKKFMEQRDIREKVFMKEACAPPSSDEEFTLSDEERFLEPLRRVRFNLDKARGDCTHRACKYIQLGTKVLRGSCMEHDEHSVVYLGIDVSNGDPNLIREYILKPQEKQTSKELLSDVLKQLDSIQKELLYLKRFHYEYLVLYLDFKHIVEKDHIVTYLTQEFVSNVSLASYGSWHVAADFAFIRHVVIGVLHALAYLHQHNVFHKNIKSSSVYLSKRGEVKLGDYSLIKRMEDLQLSCRQIHTGGGCSKVGRAADILQLATLVLGLLQMPADPINPPALPAQVPPDLRDFLAKCFLEEERRWTAQQLLKHEFVITTIPQQPSTRDRRASGSGAGLDPGEDEEEDTDQLISQFKIPNDLKYQSRLSSEFRVLKYLGSGSFGKVLKAKNRLDGGIYAIKAIELNPRNKQLNRKMIREVKLLSKLNHENVVRYFNSWIETTNVDDSSSVTQVTSTPLQSLTEIQSLRALEPHSGLSRAGVGGEGDDEEEDEVDGAYDEDSDDEDEDKSLETENNNRFDKRHLEPSESIVFADSGGGGNEDSAVEMEMENSESVKQIRSLYIQMEFCEKSTLRIAIDEGGLFEDEQRYWRLVRETVEGLAYIHQQDMIHRDLKPVNIFLDSFDHVKIGDFGLATTSVFSRSNFIVSSVTVGAADSDGSSHFHTEDSHTGGVGTSFYVAPELQKQRCKAHYNKKVDIYSLGIILFEMAHPTFTTHMERCKTLSNLRLPDIVAPSEMDEFRPRQMELIRLMLSHDPAKRPSCSEILASSLLPPPQVEDSDLQDFIRHTLSNPQSKAYKYLISSCFDQISCVEDDLTYHTDSVGSDRHYALQETVRDAVTQILRRHGARCVSTQLLLPRSNLYAGVEGCVRLMTHSGSVVVMPRDLRVPLARLAARTGVTHMRRYCVERVYRERRAHWYHPREAVECAFDIITPSPGEFVGDAEMLCVLQEMVNELPALKTRNCFVRVNHSMLLQAILQALCLDKLYSPIFHVLNEAREGNYSKTRLESCLESVPVSGSLAVTLAHLFFKEETFSKIFSEILSIVKRRDESVTMVKKALEQLKLITSHAEAMGNKIPVKVCPGVVNTSDLCNGIMFDLVCSVKQKRKNKEIIDILATGCRYDGLITKFRKMFDLTGRSAHDNNNCQAAVGMSVALDKVVSALKEDGDDVAAVSVVVCSLGQDAMARAKADMVRSLRAANLTSYVLENVETLEDLETYGRENRVSHLVWLKESERGSARVRVWERDRDRYVEKKVPVGDVVDLMARSTRLSADVDSLTARPVSTDAPTTQIFNIHIVVEDKMIASTKRRYETQIKSKMASFLANFSSRPSIEVLGLFLDLKVIKTIAANLDFSDDATDFSVNTQVIVEKYPRHKKYLTKVCDKIHSFCTEKENLVVILYSIQDDKFKQII